MRTKALILLLGFVMLWLFGCALSGSGDPKEPEYAGVYVWDLKPFHGWENAGSLLEWAHVYPLDPSEEERWMFGVFLENPPRVPRKFRLLLKGQTGIFLSGSKLMISRATRIRSGSTYRKKTVKTAYVGGWGLASPLEPESSYANAHLIPPKKDSNDFMVDFKFTEPGVYFVLFPGFMDEIPFVVEVE